MSANLFELMQGALGPTLAREASRYLGESESTTRAAVGAALPAVLGSLMQQGSMSSGAADVFRSLTGSQIDTGLISRLGGMLAVGDKSVLSLGNTLIGSLFGDRTSALADAISSMSGMKTSSVSTVLALAAPTVFSYLKGYLGQNKLDLGGLMSLLAGQREYLRAELDDRLIRALGFGGSGAFLSSLATGVPGQATGAAARMAGAARDAGSEVGRAGVAAYDAVERVPAAVPVFRSPWLWGLLAALALLAWVL